MSRPTREGLTAADLRELLTYEPETGRLVWKARHLSLFPSGLRACQSWNARFAGREAFTAHDNHAYKVGAIFGRRYLAHRVIWCLAHGEWPSDQVDHQNGDRADNRLSNLREVSNSTNHKNQKTPVTNTSGMVGVYLEPRTGAWVAQIYHEGQRLSLGTFTDKDLAAVARKQAETDLGYHENHGRRHG